MDEEEAWVRGYGKRRERELRHGPLYPPPPLSFIVMRTGLFLLANPPAPNSFRAGDDRDMPVAGFLSFTDFNRSLLRSMSLNFTPSMEKR